MATLKRADILAELGRLNPGADEITVRRLSSHIFDYQRAQANIDEHGVLVSHPKTGAPMSNPYVPVRAAAEREIVRILSARALSVAGLWAGDSPVAPPPVKTRPVGRPSSLTPEVAEVIFSRLRRGTAVETACRLAGIDQSTYHNWRKKGREGDEKYRDFFEQSEEAMLEWEESMLEQIADDADWKAKRAALELRRRQYRPSSTIEVTGPDGGPVQTALSILDQRLQSLGLPREVLQSMATPATPTITADTESPHWRDPEEEP